MVAVTVVAWSLLGLAALVAGLLAATLRIGARVDGQRFAAWVGVGVVDATVELPERVLIVRLLGARVVRRRLDRGARSTRRDAAPRRRERSRSAGDASGPMTLLSLRARLRAYRRVLRGLVRGVRVDACAGHVRIATPDPALTGLAYGCAEGVRALLPDAHRRRVSVEPDFVGELPGGRATLAVRVRVAVLALAAWRLFWYERGRSSRARRGGAVPWRRSHATHGNARGARGAGA